MLLATLNAGNGREDQRLADAVQALDDAQAAGVAIRDGDAQGESCTHLDLNNSNQLARAQ
jgi:hypothetical protein